MTGVALFLVLLLVVFALAYIGDRLREISRALQAVASEMRMFNDAARNQRR